MKKLLEEIEANILERGYEIPIETRMKKSIYRSFEKSGVQLQDLESNARSVWGGSIYKRFEKLGLEKAYLGIFSLKSHSVHGNWQEIMTNHLKYHDGLFEPNTSWDKPRPQSILSMGYLICETALEYLDIHIPACPEKNFLKSMIQDLMDRIKEVDELLEIYCTRRMKE